MEADGSESEGQDIFAGVQVPFDESESEYEESDDGSQEDRQAGRKTQKKTFKANNKKKLGTGNAFDGQENDDSEEVDRSNSSKGKKFLSHAQSPSKRKQSPIKLSGHNAKKAKTTGNWMFHSKYRDLINIDITDIVSHKISTDKSQLEGSQVGASTWTSLEKDTLFHALSRLGQDNITGISERILTKSESEVQEYLGLLHKSFIERRIRAATFGQPDFPAAVEVSAECCEQLEKVADAFAALQEKHEIKNERAKWGDSWLLTPETSHWLNKKRNQKNGTQAINDVLPAVNLFDLDVWLELSDRIFMNSGPSENEDNWANHAEDSEGPSIRATAFEDFHTLALFITKKLVSTTLFCTMSRQRAIHSTKTKAAEVNAEDVRAAVDILKMSHTGEAHWKTCARRCKLQVINDENDTEADDGSPMSYDEVEEALSGNRSQSRSRSRSKSLSHFPPPLATENTASEESEAEELDNDDIQSSPHSAARSTSPSLSAISDIDGARTRLKRAADREAHILAVEEYTEALDQQASLAEELRLWAIIKQDVPESVLLRVQQVQEEEELKRPRKREEERDDRYEWREWVDYRAEWEDVEGRPTEDEFMRNRQLRKRRWSESGEVREERANGLSSEFVIDEDGEVPDGEGAVSVDHEEEQ